MPTYQYRCSSCSFEFEEFQRITDDPVAKCPKCGKKPKRIITGGAGFVLKGSGFYSTDYRSESYKAAARKDNGFSGDSGKSSSKSSKSTPKPAPKSKDA